MIHGHIYNIPNLPELFFMYKAGCLGWGTWSDRWREIEFDGNKLLSEIKKRNLNGEESWLMMPVFLREQIFPLTIQTIHRA